MDNQSLEKRIEELEKEVAELRAEVRGKPTKDGWLKNVGWAKDDPVYDEAMRLGAAWRRRENRKSIKELERQGLIDADPGHRSSDRTGSRRGGKRVSSKTP